MIYAIISLLLASSTVFASPTSCDISIEGDGVELEIMRTKQGQSQIAAILESKGYKLVPEGTTHAHVHLAMGIYGEVMDSAFILFYAWVLDAKYRLYDSRTGEVFEMGTRSVSYSKPSGTGEQRKQRVIEAELKVFTWLPLCESLVLQGYR